MLTFLFKSYYLSLANPCIPLKSLLTSSLERSGNCRLTLTRVFYTAQPNLKVFTMLCNGVSSVSWITPFQVQTDLLVSCSEKLVISVTLSPVLILCMVILLEKIFWPRLVMCRRNPPLLMQATIHSTPQIRTSTNNLKCCIQLLLLNLVCAIYVILPFSAFYFCTPSVVCS